MAKITIGVALFIPLVALCQTPGRDLSGRVKAASGSPIPNARVSVKNLASGDTFSAVTSEDGSYRLARLPPGNYDVSVAARGFASVRTTVAIHADQDQVADLTLPSGNEQGTSSTVSGVVSGKNVSDLPLNGRSARHAEVSTRPSRVGPGRVAMGGVFEASSGVPFTPGFAGDTLGVKSIDPNIDVPNLLSGTGCASPINPGNSNHYIKTQCFGVPNPINLRGNLGRNTLIGPGLINLDSSVFKNNRIKSISDRFNIQFRSEFFNHTYSTLLHDLGTPVKVQQTLLGHSSASTTMDVYTHPVSGLNAMRSQAWEGFRSQMFPTCTKMQQAQKQPGC